MIKIYGVKWKIPEGGSYIPPDLVGCGDCYRDKYGTDIITATSIKMAKEIIKEARPSAIITSTKILRRIE